MAAKVHIITYGCTFNQADTDAMKAALAVRGDFEFSNAEGDADVVVMNTCSVKDGTQDRILHKAMELEAAGKKLVMAGCLAQAAPEAISKAVPGSSILGTQASSEIADVISAAAAGLRIVQTRKTRKLPFNVTVDGVIARVQISRGCLSNCSYCSTKLARGRLESFPPGTIAEGVAAAVQKGAKEIQLTSQDTGCYGFDLEPRTDLAALVAKLCEIPGRFRIRIGMGSPEHFISIKEALAEAMQDGKVYRFLHIPVQSGSDGVLSEMRRKYTAGQYAALVGYFRSALPDIMIETDVIVGFPAEAGADFEKTMELLKSIKPWLANVSKYSARPKTAAARLAQLDNQAIKKRSEVASSLCRELTLEENAKMDGMEVTALVTEKARNGFLARTDNYKPVLLAGGSLGRFVTVKITGYGQSHLKTGNLVENSGTRMTLALV